ncbi:MAG TPA: low temperature requirement protein A, partial [Lysobacter sp.]|nr:low temperature requirement protein A [Lysobacter sp.]
FDLVFVFAVTQLSHALLADLSIANALRVALMLLAVWWVWIYTSWVTNWLDPERLPVRIGLFVLMLAGVLLSASIPQAFGERGLVFAGAYAFMQVGRTLFFLWAARDGLERLIRNFQRILAWLLLSAVFWIAGGFAQGEARLAWWALALLVEFISPLLYFWVPGMGRSSTTDWDVDGAHLAERCALFIIIALGESLLVTGATFAELQWDASTITGFLSAVVGTILMWWIYFDTGARRAEHLITHSSDPGKHARRAYTYMHALIVAGIIVCAVADEVVLVHPHHAEAGAMAAILGGPACYLAGTALFKWSTNDRLTPPLSHMAGIVLLALLAAAAWRLHLSPLVTGVGTTTVLAMVAVWESLALRRGT